MSEQIWGPFQIFGSEVMTPAGPVYRARHHPTGQNARVFTLLPGQARSGTVAREFYRRQRAASLLSEHPHFLTLLETGAYDGVAYYACIQPDGIPLPLKVAPVEGSLDRPAPTPLLIRHWLSEIASMVSFAHQQGLILGNLSPYSIWIGTDGSASLMDPGATLDDRWWLSEAPLYVGALLAGSPTAYLAPEQILGKPVDTRADIYALGMILFWLLGGHFPPQRHEDAARIGRYLPIPDLSPGRDLSLGKICRKAAQLQISSRFSSADLLCAELLASPQERAAAANRAGLSGRHTLIRGLPAEDIDLAPHPRDQVGGWLVRWFHNWL